MKITLKDFGPISHFEFDLEKDLHVIFGKNNIGKSYAITAVYLILKNLVAESNQSGIKSKIISDAVKEITGQLNGKKDEYIDISKVVETAFKGFIFLALAQKLSQSFNSSFVSINRLSNKRSENKFSICIQQKHFTTTLHCNTALNALSVNDTKVLLPILVKRTNGLTEGQFSLKCDNQEVLFDELSDVILHLYDIFVLKDLYSINEVYFLPASRSGLYQTLNSFSPIIAELSKSRNFLTQKIELPSISEPVADYFLNLSNIDNRPNNDFNDIIEAIENDILKGVVAFDNDKKKIVFKENGIDEELELSYASSMVSEIAPIVAYLKYILKGENNSLSSFGKAESEQFGLLFIEEPEAHLHPDVQVKLMEMFALLAGKKVKIVMTSHSNYMFNKLSNLILDGKIEHERVGSYLMRATEVGSVTDMLSMKAEADGMNDENFADTAEMLYEERIKIYERLNKTSENAD